MAERQNYKKRRPNFTMQIVSGLLFGIAWGLFFGEHGTWVRWIGNSFVGLLQMAVLPYVALTLTCNVGRLSVGQGRRLARVAFLVLLVLWLAGLSTLAVFSLAFPDWKAGSFFSTSLVEEPTTPNWLELFIPSNPFWSLTNNLVPAVVLFSLGLGVALMRVPNKERLLDTLDVLIEGLSRLNRLVVSLSPIGIFGIVGHNAGTLSLEQFGLLQGYLLVYGAAAVLLTFVLLPSLLAGCTPFSHRELLNASRDMLITAFIIGNTFVVLPMIIDALHKLTGKFSGGDDSFHSPEYSVQLAYPFPDVGRIVGLVFIPFAAWFYGTSIDPSNYPQLLGVGFVGSFAKPVLTVPLLLNLAHIPGDIFNLFLAVGVIAARFGDLMKVMHLFAFSILTTCILSGVFRFDLRRLVVRFVVTASVVAVTVLSIRAFLVYSFQDDYSKEDLVVARQLLGSPVEATVLEQSAPNPVALSNDLDRLERIQHRGIVRIGINPDALPFAYYNEARQLVGLDIDMAHQLARDLGVQIEFVPFSEDVSGLLRSDHFDIAMSGLEGTTKRAIELPHVDPYLEITVALVVPDYRRKEFRSLEQIEKLDNLRIAVIADSKASEVQPGALVGWGSRKRLAELEIVKLASKRDFFESDPPVADVLVTSAESGSAWTLRYPQFNVVKPNDLNVRLPLYYFVADESQFEEFLENWLALKRRDGTIQQLYDYWILGKDNEEHVRRWSIVDDVLDWESLRGGTR